MNNQGPRHPLAKWFVGEFDLSLVESFVQFEFKVSSLPTERARGDAFEVFAEAWLATQRIPQARDIWPCDTSPPSLQKSLNLPLNDMGVDGIFESAVEEPTCYQVKFRTGRPRLSWSELSTFFGLADASCGRLVFTNCDEVARVAQDRREVIFVRGGDLDRLTRDDLRLMGAWLSGAVVARKTKTPRPHQEAAIADILIAFEHHMRATALMACATGKTLVALWVAERIGARTVLVLLPSLALVRQTLHEWLHETNWPEPRYICVCSDPTVLPEEDALVVRQTDLDFKVTTESAAVRRFLERPTTTVRMVFSTYQSSGAVAAAMVGLTPFDLGIFDEAHKTAGLEGMKSALALKDDQLPILRRLFLTATPRHYSVGARDKIGNAKVVFSMDVPEVYGVVAHRLPFCVAAKAGIITNYKVVISIVTSEEVTAEALRRGVVLVKGDKVKARQVANQIALQAAIARYGVRKIFTFHGRVASAESFVSSGPEGIATHIPDFHCDHISGAMPTGQRERRMREFEGKPCAVMSNARCLTEGVDVPAVDMVAFLSPRRSLVDIVQATGRAMRKADGKTFGYVFVPLYVEQSRGETNLEAVKRSNYDEVWNVLNRLQEHDDLLAQIIEQMRQQKGETGGYDDARFRERVEMLGPSLSLEELRSSITAACLDAIGDPWMERYGQLTAYYKKNGNCDIPVRYAANKMLATWVVAQRYERKNQNLSTERIALLDRLGFTWDPYSAEWRGNYLSLLAFKERNGHCEVLSNSREYPKLGRWVKTQRIQRKRQRLSSDRIELLDRIGFEWAARISTWEKRFTELVEYKKRFDHTRVPAMWKENPELGQWVAAQRYKRRTKRLPEKYEQRLNSIGFEREVRRAIPDVDSWEAGFLALVSYHERTDGFIFSRADKEHRALAAWVQEQRALKRRGQIIPDRELRLNEIDFPWESTAPGSEVHWRRRFEELRAYAAEHSSVLITKKDAKSRSLNEWVMHQRKLKKTEKLSEERRIALDSLGFVWAPHRGRSNSRKNPDSPDQSILKWDEMHAALTVYFQRFGNCDVPAQWEANPALARWVEQQRTAWRRHKITADHDRKLSLLGFSWSLSDVNWEAKFNQFAVQNRVRTNDSSTRAKKTLTPELNRWALTQRQFKKRRILDPDRERRLTNIGFVWEPFSKRWEEMYGLLREYREKHNHCRVPTKWPENQTLSNWVAVQRRHKQLNRLSADRITLLDALGFNWVVHSSENVRSGESWDTMYLKLREYVSSSAAVRNNGAKPSIELGRWMQTQRQFRKSGRLTIEREKKLNDVHFEWNPFEIRWQQMFDALRQYRAEHGNCRVLGDWPKNPRLASWVEVQRTKKTQGKLSTSRIAALQSLEFEWAASAQPRRVNSDSWAEMCAALQKYKDRYGDCRVPQRWKENRSLADWVHRQRTDRKQRRITPENEQELNFLGFDWEPITSRWDTMFRQLVEYKKKYGNTNVRERDPKYAQLANWVRIQRRDKKLKRPIGATRLHRLDELGFTWVFIEHDHWENMFQRLVNFKKREGHCNVPQRFKENIKFGRWVNTQRLRFKKGKMPSEEMQRLEALGFSWNTKTGL